MAGLGLAVVGMVALVASTWTVNVSNAYSAGLAFAVMLGKGERGYKDFTIVSGAIGIVWRRWASWIISRSSLRCSRP